MQINGLLLVIPTLTSLKPGGKTSPCLFLGVLMLLLLLLTAELACGAASYLRHDYMCHKSQMNL